VSREEMGRLLFSYSVNERTPWGSLDPVLDELAKRYGFEEAGAGTGFGMRDVDYCRDTKLTESEIMNLRLEVKCFELTYARYVWEVWEDDDLTDEGTWQDLMA
jgi:hypothetical protein